MSAGTGNLKGTLHIILTLYLAEIKVEAACRTGKFGARIHNGRIQSGSAAQKISHLAEIVNAIDLKIIYHCGLGSICRG